MLRKLIAMTMLFSGPALADPFYEPQGMDAKTAAAMYRAIAEAYSRDNVISGETQVTTIGPYHDAGGGAVVCQQGVRNSTAGRQPGVADPDEAIVVIDSNNICIGR